MSRADFHLTMTGIGSMPGKDAAGTCRLILENLEDMPFWPQLADSNPMEDMVMQQSGGLPGVRVREDGRDLLVSRDRLEEELTEFYERYIAEDVDAFSLGPDRAKGLYELLSAIKRGEGGAKGRFIKGQSAGPITMASAIRQPDGKPLLHDQELMEALVKALSIKLLWQVGVLAETGRRVVVFMDEPALSGVGSAFSAMDRDQVTGALAEIIQCLRERSDALVGIHCCDNTDWAMVLRAGPDIVSFDAFGYMESFLLYREPILEFLERGGGIAWGIVPTVGSAGGESPEDLRIVLEGGLSRICSWGVDRNELEARSILTPACGTGTMTPEAAARAIRMLPALKRAMGMGQQGPGG